MAGHFSRAPLTLIQLQASAATAANARSSGGANGASSAYSSVQAAAASSSGLRGFQRNPSRGQLSRAAASSATRAHGSSDPSSSRSRYQRHTGQKQPAWAAISNP